jgi:hypothetical protein
MAKMKTSELTGAALDWAVAKCEGYFDKDMAWIENGKVEVAYYTDYSPSTNWAQGGEIIERERIDVMWCGDRWCAYAMTPDGETQLQDEGDTPLVAAMRCYVASQLGAEIEIPKELTHENL